MSSPTPASPLHRLLAVMRRLRGPGGCPWDREQTFATLAPFAIEEAYEVVDAAERNDMEHLKDELGDLLFQVIFHAQLAAEAGYFDFDAVATAITDKLVRRHPYVFGVDSLAGLQEPRSAAAQSVVWEDIKAAERTALPKTTADPSALNGIPLALPALLRAGKLSRRAARVGFDFAHARETADKVAEELAEVRQAADSTQVFEEVGDLLFAAANLARKLDVDAEAALRAANVKFERRFRGMEQLAAQRRENFADLGLAAQEALWQEVKRAE